MVIVNNSTTKLLVCSEQYVLEYPLEPGEQHNFIVSYPFKISVFSDIGSVLIKIEYGKLNIQNFGNLVATVRDTKDENGNNVVIVTNSK